jgi:hypothetical protein
MFQPVRLQYVRKTQNRYEQRLMIANRHMADVRRRTAEQRLRIARMHILGLETREAEWLLREFEDILQEMPGHKQMVVDKMQDAA